MQLGSRTLKVILYVYLFVIFVLVVFCYNIFLCYVILCVKKFLFSGKIIWKRISRKMSPNGKVIKVSNTLIKLWIFCIKQYHIRSLVVYFTLDYSFLSYFVFLRKYFILISFFIIKYPKPGKYIFFSPFETRWPLSYSLENIYLFS